MLDQPILSLRPYPIEGVTVVDLIPRELTEPDQATRLGEGLRSIAPQSGPFRLLINATATKYMSSTAFAVLFSFGKAVSDAGGRVAICDMDSFVRLGADIIKLSHVIPIYDDEPTALASLVL